MISVKSNKSCTILLNSGLFSEAYRHAKGWHLVLVNNSNFSRVLNLIQFHKIKDYSMERIKNVNEQ